LTPPVLSLTNFGSSPARPTRRQKAIGALAASILTTLYHMLKGGTLYQDLSPDHFDRRAKAVQISRLVTRLQNLGYAVQIIPLAA
jgi:transposase